MSYWNLPDSIISISCATVQNLTNIKKHDKWNKNMGEFSTVTKNNTTAKYSDMTKQFLCSNPKIDPARVLDLDNEDEEFLEEQNFAINNREIT